MVLAIAAVADAGDPLSISLPLGYFGAACVLVSGFPDLPFSQARNVLFGYLLSSLMKPCSRQPAGASCSARH